MFRQVFGAQQHAWPQSLVPRNAKRLPSPFSSVSYGLGRSRLILSRPIGRYNSPVEADEPGEEPAHMNGTIVSFFTFQLPTAATWVYFSLLLAAALFVKFSRLLSIRNWDVLTLF